MKDPAKIIIFWGCVILTVGTVLFQVLKGPLKRVVGKILPLWKVMGYDQFSHQTYFVKGPFFSKVMALRYSRRLQEKHNKQSTLPDQISVEPY